MITLLFFICIVMMVLGFLSCALKDKSKMFYDLYYSDLCDIMTGVGGVGALITAIFLLTILVMHYNTSKLLDDRILMYTEENEKIERQVSTIVTDYMNYESSTFTNCKSDDIVVAVSLYPELKSDELVKSQIEIYQENNKKIKELKEQKIDGRIYSWLLYFG